MTYKVIKQVWTPDGLVCEHSLCETLHKPWRKRDGNSWYCAKPAGERTEWFIHDDETGEPLHHWSIDPAYDLKRDAVSALKRYFEILARESQPTNA